MSDEAGETGATGDVDVTAGAEGGAVNTSQVLDRLEAAPTGRARCRACGRNIDKGALRFGEVVPNAYGEGDATSVFWFHPLCAAHRRPPKLAALARDPERGAALPEREALLAAAEEGIAHERLARVAGAERASSGRARCRECKELIAQGTWRIRLSNFAETGFFEPLGFVHASCAGAYFGTSDLKARLRQAAPDLDDAALAEIAAVGS